MHPLKVPKFSNTFNFKYSVQLVWNLRLYLGPAVSSSSPLAPGNNAHNQNNNKTSVRQYVWILSLKKKNVVTRARVNWKTGKFLHVTDLKQEIYPWKKKSKQTSSIGKINFKHMPFWQRIDNIFLGAAQSNYKGSLRWLKVLLNQGAIITAQARTRWKWNRRVWTQGYLNVDACSKSHMREVLPSQMALGA